MDLVPHRRPGDVVALRYILTDGRIEMCWPCRAEREEKLHRAWARLERGHQSIFALRAEGYSLPEIAEITELPIDAR